MEPTRPNKVTPLLNSVIEGIRDKKGAEITLLDLTDIDGAVCDYMILAEGRTHTQVEAIEDSIFDVVLKRTGDKPVHTHYGSGEWIAMDYVDVMIHILTPELRAYYRIEQNWSDARLEHIADE